MRFNVFFRNFEREPWRLLAWNVEGKDETEVCKQTLVKEKITWPVQTRVSENA